MGECIAVRVELKMLSETARTVSGGCMPAFKGELGFVGEDDSEILDMVATTMKTIKVDCLNPQVYVVHTLEYRNIRLTVWTCSQRSTCELG
ncbi:hypothetical protein Brsp01_13230 [Brucella sp. NBRC 12950]|nr:hypothetical protein Brsp01_13230 [Brucella sp. NBRC 12950]